MNDEPNDEAAEATPGAGGAALEIRVMCEMRAGERAYSVEARWHVPGSPEPQPMSDGAAIHLALSQSVAVLAQGVPIAPPSRVLVARPSPQLIAR